MYIILHRICIEVYNFILYIFYKVFRKTYGNANHKLNLGKLLLCTELYSKNIWPILTEENKQYKIKKGEVPIALKGISLLISTEESTEEIYIFEKIHDDLRNG